MPRITDDLEEIKLPTSQYGYTRVKKEKLTAAEYSVVTIIIDVSGSVQNFANELETCVKEVIKSCAYSPRADNLLLRVVAFGSKMIEYQGFKLLSEINENDFDGYYNKCQQLGAGYQTALIDSVENAVSAAISMGEDLTKDDYLVNSLIIIVTDGMDNASTLNTKHIKTKLEEAKNDEKLESINTILVKVNVGNDYVNKSLDNFANNVGITQVIETGNVNKKSFAKLANFISKSITSSSIALGSGQPSQPITF